MEMLPPTIAMSRAEIAAMSASLNEAAAKAATSGFHPTGRQQRILRYVAIGFGCVALVEAAVLLWPGTRRAPGAAGAAATVAPAPATRARRAHPPIEAGVDPVAGRRDDGYPAAPAVRPAAAAPATRVDPVRSVIGWVRVKSDVEVRVYANGRLLGVGVEGTYRLTEGKHDIRLINELVGIDLRQPVHILPGQTVSIVRTSADR